jgi:hypothetical protein
MGAVRLSQLSRGAKEPLVAFGPAHSKHLHVFWIEGEANQGHLDDAAKPRGVESDFLSPWIIASRGKRLVDVLMPQAAEPGDIRGQPPQLPAFS